MIRKLTFAAAVVASLATSTIGAQNGSTSVLGTSNLFMAGGNAGPGSFSFPGTSPVLIALNAGVGRIARFDASGLWTCCTDLIGAGNGPDGAGHAGPNTNINSLGSIAGLQGPNTMFLAGLFLGASLPGSAPSRNVYGAGDYALQIQGFGGIGQTFFIGDGLTGTGSGLLQEFLVPDNAEFLYLGVVDAFGFTGDPGWYDDNNGSVTVRYDISGDTVVPEPASIALVAIGMLGIGAGVRRRRQS